MIELKTNLEQLEKYADELFEVVDEHLKQLLRDSAADIRSLKMEVFKLEAGSTSLGNALFELIYPNLERFLREQPTNVDVKTMRSVVYDMVNEGEILVEVDTSDISITVDTIDLSANVDSLELSLANDR
jgi:Tfp pilus assembly protein PilO